MASYFLKLKKASQVAGINSGWNQHIAKYTKRKANKQIRRILKTEVS